MVDEEKVLLDKKYPGNSNKSKEKKELTPVTKGKAKKPSIFKRLADTFIADDVEDVKSYIFFDVLIPAMKDTIVDMGKTAIDMIFYGDSGKRKKSNKPYKVSYSSYYEQDKKPRSKPRPTIHNFDDILIDSRGEAEEVLDQLSELILEYGQATVSDLYELVGMPDNFTDNNYGWTSLEKASVSRTREGYILNLPKPELLD